MVSLSNEGPLYHVGQEFTSARMTRQEKLNIEEAVIKSVASDRLLGIDLERAAG